MIHPYRYFTSLRLVLLAGCLLLTGILSACSPLVAVPPASEAIASYTPTSEPTSEPASATPTLAPTSLPPTRTLEPARSPTATAAWTPTPAPTLAPCLEGVCTYRGVFPFQRPIFPPAQDRIDPAYRFGSTQSGLRDPHHGVEFLNPSGTEVHAAASGRVVVAGEDRLPVTTPEAGSWPPVFHGPYSYFYGNLIVIEHVLPGFSQPVYSLYAHLSEILVREGDEVQPGQLIGKVGMTGVATGHHLHFEVRFGENTYAASRNPELWLAPHTQEDGTLNGALAGRVIGPDGSSLEVENIVLQHLTSQDGPADFEQYVRTYEDKTVRAGSPWADTFGAGDLPPGWYRLSFAQYGFQRHLVQVLPGQLTVVVIQVGQDQAATTTP